MKKHIPNSITLCNLLSGCIGCIFALRGRMDAVLLCVLLSGLFDFLDGFTARLIGAYSEIGKELDSLADDISFGLVPAISLYSFYNSGTHIYQWLAYTALLISAFSALRLAKFNLDERQAKSFLGMPTPACALLVVPLGLYAQQTTGVLHSLMISEWFIPILSILLSFLLICEIPMLSMKQFGKRQKAFFAGSAVIIVACLISVRTEVWYLHPALWLTLIFSYYILLNIILTVFDKKSA